MGERPDAEGSTARERPELPLDRLPRHIAFIMDGNGRWAKSRGLPRIRGHEKGAEALRKITRFCRSLGIQELTFFALSTENFQRRPFHEVKALMRLLRSYLVSERRELLDNGIRLRAIGRFGAFSEATRRTLRKTEALTAGQSGMVLRLALNYGGRQEILDAMGEVVRRVAEGSMTAEQLRELGEKEFRRHLYDPEMTDPDLLIRTAGEFRLSNFVLWQCAYTEIWVTPALWPDFDEQALEGALRSYGARERKYGALPRVEVGSPDSVTHPSGAPKPSKSPGPEEGPARS